MVYERFTPTALNVIILAQEEARRIGRNSIETEQLLLALMEEESGVASKVLNSLGVNLASARLKVEQITGFGSGVAPDEVIKYSPTAEHIVVSSSQEALHLGSNSIDTEHLLLALIHAEESTAVTVLTQLGVDLKQVSTQIYNIRNE